VSQARLWIEEVSDRHVGKPSEHYAIFRERNERIRPGGVAERPRAVVVACLLQRSSKIQSAGGYLRELTRKAGEGEFSLGPVLMAQINAKNRERRSA
jgi:hypothetical protein